MTRKKNKQSHTQAGKDKDVVDNVVDSVVSPNKFSVLDSDEECEDAPCRVCSEDVSKETDGLQCDRCDGWVHSEVKCSDLSKSHFNFMKKCKNPAIKFICLVCRDIESADVKPRDAICRDAIAKNAAKIDSVGESIKLLKKQNNEILDYMKLKSKTDDSIKLHVTEAVNSQKQKEERQLNLIIYNITEADPKAPSAQSEIEDLQKVKNVFNFVCPSLDISGLASSAVTRCGNKRVPNSQFPNPKPRPIRVVLQRTSDVILIRKNARKLKDNESLRHVGISEDKSYQERMEDRQLRADLLKRRNENNEDVVIYNREIKLRSELPNYRKSTSDGTGVPKVSGQPSVRVEAGGNSTNPN